MAAQLSSMFAEAEKISLQAKMKFVMLTQLTTARAKDLPDDPEMVKKCKEAIVKVKAEFGGNAK